MIMSEIRTVLATSGLAIFLRRMQLTNQWRLDNPPTETDALAIARDSKVPLEFRILHVHHAMNVAIGLKKDGDKLWGQIGTMLQDDFTVDEIPVMTLGRFCESVTFKSMRIWARDVLSARPKQGTWPKQQQAA